MATTTTKESLFSYGLPNLMLNLCLVLEIAFALLIALYLEPPARLSECLSRATGWSKRFSLGRRMPQFLSLCAGDPFRADARYGEGTTTEELCGYAPQDTIPSRPVLPLSYADAAPLLAQLGGAPAPADFVGGIDALAYTLGPSDGLEVRIETDNPFVTTDIWNVVGTIPGEDDLSGANMDMRRRFVDLNKSA